MLQGSDVADRCWCMKPVPCCALTHLCEVGKLLSWQTCCLLLAGSSVCWDWSSLVATTSTLCTSDCVVPSSKSVVISSSWITMSVPDSFVCFWTTCWLHSLFKSPCCAWTMSVPCCTLTHLCEVGKLLSWQTCSSLLAGSSVWTWCSCIVCLIFF